jgi:LacI family transcriptional regulator
MTSSIRDVARITGLSITTVSRALDGYSDVSKNTRERVILAAREAGYHPSTAARQLRRQKADAVGYILPTPSPRFSDPYYSTFLSGVCDEAGSQKFDLIVSSAAPESEAEKTIYRSWVESRKVDGLVINRSRVHDWRVRFLLENHLPFVALSSLDEEPAYPCVRVNDRETFTRLANHLIGNGHRQIAYIGANPELIVEVERYSGYVQALGQAHLQANSEYIIHADLTQEGGYQAASQLLQLPQPPTAIMAINDLTALGVYQAVQQKGCVVGRDIAVTGYDGFQEAEFASPPLTTAFQPTYEIARQLTRMLQAVINKHPLDSRVVEFSSEISIRPSSDFKLQA